MKYYDLSYNYSHSDDLIFLQFDESELSFGRYDVDKPEPLPVKQVYCTIAEDQTGECDYLANDLTWLVVSDKVKTVMEETLNIGVCDFVDVLEKTSGKHLGYLVHCRNYHAALDLEHSLGWRRDDKDHLSDDDPEKYVFWEYAIREDKTEGHDIFRLKEAHMPIFVSEKFRKAIKKNKLTGFDFSETPRGKK